MLLLIMKVMSEFNEQLIDNIFFIEYKFSFNV